MHRCHVKLHLEPSDMFLSAGGHVGLNPAAAKVMCSAPATNVCVSSADCPLCSSSSATCGSKPHLLSWDIRWFFLLCNSTSSTYLYYLFFIEEVKFCNGKYIDCIKWYIAVHPRHGNIL